MRRLNSEEYCKDNTQSLMQLALKKDTPLTEFLDAYEITTNKKELNEEIAE